MGGELLLIQGQVVQSMVKLTVGYCDIFLFNIFLIKTKIKGWF